MRILETRKNFFDFYCSEMADHGYKIPYSAHYKRLVREVAETLGDKYEDYVRLLAKHFEEIKDTFYEDRYTRLSYPHPKLFNNKDIIEFLEEQRRASETYRADIDNELLDTLGIALRGKDYGSIRDMFSSYEDKKLFVTTLVYAMKICGFKVNKGTIHEVLFE